MLVGTNPGSLIAIQVLLLNLTVELRASADAAAPPLLVSKLFMNRQLRTSDPAALEIVNPDVAAPVTPDIAMRLSSRKPEAALVLPALPADVLDKVGLKAKGFKMPFELSGGEQQRVDVARALLNSPKVILADEPTGNLDSINTQEIIEILKKINEFGTTIVLVTHNREIVNQLRRRVVVLHGGKIASDEREGKYRI
mgnify:CR=1 FL=1